MSNLIQQASAQEEEVTTEEEGEPEVVDELSPGATEEEQPPTTADVVPEGGGGGGEEQPTPGQSLTTTEEEGQQPLSALFFIDSTNGDTAPATFLFEADAQGGTGPYTYSWNFGDGSPQGSGISIHHTFEQAGTHDVTLAVIDSTGQDISVTRQVNVRPATTTAEQPPTNQTTLTNETTTPTAQVLTIELECMNGPDGTIYCPYVPPTTGITPLPAGCISTTEGIFCPMSPNTTIANVTGTPTVNATIVVETNETDPGVVEYSCFSEDYDPKTVICWCKGVKDCLDLQASGRCDENGIFTSDSIGECAEKRRP